LTDSTGSVTVSYTYDSFGNLIDSTGTSDNTYGFTGEQQFEEADNLVFLRARYYDPKIGRFISRDPILEPTQRGGYIGWPLLYLISRPQSLHPYVYANNNPIMYKDPSGLIGHTSGCVLYTACCLFSCDTYACFAQGVCMIAGNNSWSNCVRDCLLHRYQCNQSFVESNAEHVYCYAVCTAKSLF
jgi:RHS repeat-associated protein